jgi:hypothetical protein
MKRKAFALLIDSLLALRRENKEIIYASNVKDTIKRKKPSFNETYHGYRSFSELLEDAEKHKLLELERSARSGTYVVSRFGAEMQGPPRERSVMDNVSRQPNRSRGRYRRPSGPLPPEEITERIESRYENMED